MEPELKLPDGFQDYAWEVEAKGAFWDATVRLEDLEVAVIFYDPVRLAQDVTDELAERPTFELKRVIVVRSVTEESMRVAIGRAPMGFFR